MIQAAEAGAFDPFDFPVTNYFAPIDPKYGCGVYAREIFIPKGYVLTGKIHKYAHLNFVMKGRILVADETGKRRIEAPCVFLSSPGIKRIGYAEEDTIWVTIHLTATPEESKLAEIEDEVIAKSYIEFDEMEKLI